MVVCGRADAAFYVSGIDQAVAGIFDRTDREVDVAVLAATAGAGRIEALLNLLLVLRRLSASAKHLGDRLWTFQTEQAGRFGIDDRNLPRLRFHAELGKIVDRGLNPLGVYVLIPRSLQEQVRSDERLATSEVLQATHSGFVEFAFLALFI